MKRYIYLIYYYYSQLLSNMYIVIAVKFELSIITRKEGFHFTNLCYIYLNKL